MNRVTLAIVALFGTAFLLYWQVQLKKADEGVAVDASNYPNYVAENLKSVEFNELGMVNSRVTATYMEHFDATGMTKFTSPIYLIYPDKGQAKWRLRAEVGVLNKQLGKVVLENNVIIDAISLEEPIQTIKTSYLKLDLNTMIMTSDRTVYITGTDFIIKGTGLYADLNGQNVKLTSNVEGTYEIQNLSN